MLNERVGAVTLTQVVGSPFIYARYRRRGKQVQRSLRTTDLSAARDEAQRLNATLHVVVREKQDLSFRRFALEVIERDQKKVQRGERAATLVTDQQRILRAYCGDIAHRDVRKVDYSVLQDFVDDLTDRDLSSATIKVILVLVSKTLKRAEMTGAIDHRPIMPEVSNPASVRGWFSLKEWQYLLKECKKHEDAGTKVRTQVITPELRRFATLSINTFLRPSDAKLLRHRHIDIVKTKETRYLRITTDFSKTVLSPVVSMPNAVPIYEKLLAEAKARGCGNPDDYVFMPNYKNRTFVIKTFSHQFRAVCRSADLYMAPSGQKRTLYSIRHSAIMFRLIKGKDMCLLTLARNARTSVEMIDRFYAKHLTAEMNVDVLQSMK